MEWSKHIQEVLKRHYCRVEENGGGISTVVFPYGKPLIITHKRDSNLYDIQWDNVIVEGLDEKEVEGWVYDITTDFYGNDQ